MFTHFKREVVLPQVLHFVHSLFCTSTNATLHEQFFSFQRRSVLRIFLPSWLSFPEPVYVQKHTSQSKYEPRVEKANLIHVTSQYALIQFSGGREATVPLKDVATIPDNKSLNKITF